MRFTLLRTAALVCALGQDARAASHDEGRPASLDRTNPPVDIGRETELSPGVYMTMHRIQAEAPTGDGWHRARSTLGGFSVELPLPFNDLRMRSAAEDGTPVYVDAIGGKTSGLLTYLASCTLGAEGVLEAGAARELAEGMAPEGVAPEALSRRGREGYAVSVADTAELQIWSGPEGPCQVIVEAQGDEALPEEAVRRRFFDSLRFD